MRDGRHHLTSYPRPRVAAPFRMDCQTARSRHSPRKETLAVVEYDTSILLIVVAASQGVKVGLPSYHIVVLTVLP